MNPPPIIALLQSRPLPMTSEREAQEAVWALLVGAGVGLEREVRLSSQSRIDFLLDDGTGIEVKVKLAAGRRAYLRQLERYASHDRVQSLILLTGVATGMPASIGAKPVHVVSMGRAWL